MRSSGGRKWMLWLGAVTLFPWAGAYSQRGVAGPNAPMFTPQGPLDRHPTRLEDLPRKNSAPLRDAAPVPLFRVQPRYPAELREAGIEGEVTVEFIITQKGELVSAHVVRSTHPGFEAAAVEAVQQWKFKPGVKNGRTINKRVQVPIAFTLPAKGKAGTGGSDFRVNGPPEMAPVPVSRALPQYPEEMLQANIEGNVVVEFVVDELGDVAAARAVQSSRSEFEAAAIAAVEKWKFKPGVHRGQAVKTVLQVPIMFTARGNEPSPSLPPAGLTSTAPVPLDPPGAVYPFAALLENRQATVECAVEINAAGRVGNVEWQGATEEEFRAAVEAMLEVTKFTPAMEKKVPVASIQAYKWRFNPLDGDVRITDGAAAILKRLRLGGANASFAQPEDLDATMTPEANGAPEFPHRVGPEQAKGEALIEFFVDETGQAQLPHIITASEPVFGYAACQAIATWRFTPPVKGGKPVVVKLQVPVDFKRP